MRNRESLKAYTIGYPNESDDFDRRYILLCCLFANGNYSSFIDAYLGEQLIFFNYNFLRERERRHYTFLSGTAKSPVQALLPYIDRCHRSYPHVQWSFKALYRQSMAVSSRPGAIYQQDNARPHTARSQQDSTLELESRVIQEIRGVTFASCNRLIK
ncbi:hypothetical protein TNCV_2112211 [Trichonephila clavipes]|nr:hypothetical protein TNCV_2112211 [Trichonephila clavipes]